MAAPVWAPRRRTSSKEITRGLVHVAEDLDQLAGGRTDGERAVNALAEKLRRRDCSDLIGADLAGTYVPTVLLPEGRRWLRQSASLVELFRDVLILAPVLYTWLKLSQALQAYDDYTGTSPFLLAWQQGFGGRTDRLSTSAKVVAGIVTTVVILTIVGHLFRDWYDQTVQNRQQRLAALLAEASLILNRSLLANVPDVSKVELAAIGTSISQSAQSLQLALTKSSEDITSAVNTSPGSKLHDMFDKWTKAAHELNVLGSRLQGTQEVVDHLQSVQKSLSDVATKIGTETTRMIDAFTRERSVSRQEAHAHHELASEVSEATKRLGESLQNLSEQSEQFNDMVHRLTYIVRRLDGDDSDPRFPGGGYIR